MSNYQAFYITKRNSDGTFEHLANVDVEVYDVDNKNALTTLTSNSYGQIVAGTLSVDAGTKVRFRVENYDGLAGNLTQITT